MAGVTAGKNISESFDDIDAEITLVTNSARKFKSAHIRHVPVGNNQGKSLRLKSPPCLDAVLDENDFMSKLLENLARSNRRHPIVLHNQYFQEHSRAGATR